jgi:hypothetical protein
MAGAGAVIDSIDMVSRVEVIFVCIPSPRSIGVGGPSFVVPHVQVGCRANIRIPLEDQE